MRKDTLIFSNLLISWYITHKRDLPWRKDSNPYKIWLSEIILQQTRVNQGLPYYEKFIKQYPDIFALANASIDEVLVHWQGLGYYSRARNLHATAQYIAFELDGVFPNTHKDLLKLKGVGDYTASAIASFAFSIPEAVVDGNVYRFLSRYFGIEEAVPSSKAHRFFKELAQSLMDEEQPGLFNQAIMEFGALQCTPKLPACATCPFKEKCYAYSKKAVADFPVKATKAKIKKRYFNYFLLLNDKSEMAIRKRVNKDIWFNLFELPLLESDKEMTKPKLAKALQASDLFPNFDSNSLSLLNSDPVIHKLSHQHLYVQFWEIKADMTEADWIVYEDIPTYAFPVLLSDFFESLDF